MYIKIFQLINFISDTTAKSSCPGSGAQLGTCDTGLPMVGASNNELQTITQIAFGILAALSVLFIVIGGFRFVVSEGNPENISKARETILYSVIGLTISLIAEGIVSFVIFRV